MPNTEIESALWSPFWDDRKRYDQETDVIIAHARYCSGMDGADVVTEDGADWENARYIAGGYTIVKAKFCAGKEVIIHDGSKWTVEKVEGDVVVLTEAGSNNYSLTSENWVVLV